MADESEKSASGKPWWNFPRLVIVLVVLAVFGGVLAAKAMSGGSLASSTSGDVATTTGVGTPTGAITSTHNDAAADYQAALATGKPIYLLFHSLTCQPCVEISGVADQVMPGYQDKVVFVNAITDDASGQELAANFSFQYIPTSFFISPDGTVTDSFTGSMDAARMRGYLDALIAAR